MAAMCVKHFKDSAYRKVFSSLKQNIVIKRHKLQKINIARKVNDFTIMRYAFNYIKVALREIQMHRKKSEMAAEFKRIKLLEIAFGNWGIFKLS